MAGSFSVIDDSHEKPHCRRKTMAGEIHRASKKIDIAPENWDAIIAPTSVLAIITTVDVRGNVNAASYGSTVRVCHDPVQLSFTCTRGSDTHANVLATHEFVVNLVSFDEELLEKVLIVGLPWRAGINELEKVGLTTVPSKTVAPPRIVECYAHFEMKVEWTRSWIHRMMVTGDTRAVSVTDGCVDARQMINWDVARPAHFCGGRYMDHFVPANKPKQVRWRWKPLADAGVTQADFRGPEQGVEDPVLTPVQDWRDMLRTGPRPE
jgi:flavin reductase (DIM6/NTAB) family NADH-FMN oxidoreductase RutF